ncbi:MAG: CHAT domain-containing tetratricopeptide repeat protein [Candidatus Zixiibacteriota bacterium]
MTALSGESLRRYLTTGQKPPAVTDDELATALSRQINTESQKSLKKALQMAARFSVVAHSQGRTLELASARLIANMSHFSGKYAEARTHYLRAMALAGDNAILKARLNRAIADVYMYLNDPSESRRRIAIALKVFQSRKMTDDVAMTQVNYANILHRQDKHADAEKLYRDASHHFKASGNELKLAHCQYNRANTLVQLFQMDEAESEYRSAEVIWQKHGHDLDATEARYGLAWLMMLRGDFHVALTMLQDCEDRYSQAGNRRMAALCELDRAEVYLGLHLFADARESATKSERIFRSLSLRYESAKAALFRAQAGFALGLEREANASLSRSLRGFSAENNKGFLGASWLLKSQLALKDRDISDALKKAQTCFTRAQLPLWNAVCDIHLLMLSPNLSRPFARLSSNGATHAVPHLYAAWQTLAGDRAWRNGKSLQARRHWRMAADRLDSVRAQLPPVELRTAYVSSEQSAHHKLVLAELDTNPSAAAAWSERFKTAGIWSPASEAFISDSDRRRTHESLSLLAREVSALSRFIGSTSGERSAFQTGGGTVARNLQKRIRLQFARADRGKTSDLQSIESLQSSLARASKTMPIVHFHFADNDLLAFVHEGGLARSVRFPNGRAAVSGFMRRWRFILESELLSRHLGPVVSPREEELLFDSIGEWLWSPLKIATGTKNVLIIPEGGLSNLPWPAIRVGGEPLIARHCILVNPSFRHYTKAEAVRVKSDSIAIFAGQSEDLPEVRHELQELATLAGPNATIFDPCLREHWPVSGEAKVWHFSGHASLRKDNPFYSFLHLADGPLFATDFRLRETKVGVVTLASCRSGEQVSLPGEESEGLVRSLLEMGARTVIAGHWPVADASTALWMKTFYGRYLKGGGVAESARLAAETVRVSHPSAYHWAAFSIFGAAD